jgi:hypothetical protein
VDPAEVMAELDAVVASMESELAEAREVLARTEGPGAESLAVALLQLEDKIVAARAKRDALAKRIQRAERQRSLAAEMRAVRLELEQLVAAGHRNERYEELRRRALELNAEAQKLKGTA